MSRLDLNNDVLKTPGTDNSKGPYSSLFDWDAEEERYKKESADKKSAQQKIMRTNAVGDAFRLLIDAVGGANKATIVPKTVNPGIMKAIADYSKIDEDYRARLEGLSAKKLSVASSDLTHKLGTEAKVAEERLTDTRKAADYAHQEKMQNEKYLNDFIQENTILEKTYRLRGDENAAEGVRKKILAANEAGQAIELARKKAQFDRGWGLNGDEEMPQFDLATPSKSSDKNQKIPFIVPDIPTKTIQIPTELIDEIRFQMIGPDGNKYDPQVSEALRAILKNKKPEISSLMQEIRTNWPIIKEKMKDFAPSAYSQIYGQIGNEIATTPTQQTSTIPIQQKQEDGSVDLDDNSKNQLLTKIKGTLNDVSFKDNDKIKKVADFIYNTYQAAGLDLSANDALVHANDYMRQWRSQQKKQKETDSTKVK